MLGASSLFNKAAEQHKEAYNQKTEETNQKIAEKIQNTPLTESEQEEVYSSPYMTYNVVDSGGNVTGTVQGSQEVFNAYKNSTMGTYDVGTKTFKPTDTTVSITIDEKSGNVNIKAPQELLNQQEYMKSLTETTDKISENYKLNKDYQYELASGDKTNTQGYLDYLAKDATEQANNAVSIASNKVYHKTANGVDLNDEQVIRSGTYGAKLPDGTTSPDDTRMVIPEGEEFNFLRQVDTYDPETRTAEYGDVKNNAWVRDTHSDEIVKANEYLDAYFNNGDFSDKDKYADMYAFKQFSDNTETTYKSDLLKAADFITDVADGAISGMVNGVIGLFAGIELASSGNKKYDTVEHGFWNGIFNETLKWEQSFQTNTEHLRGSESIAFAVSNVLAPIGVDIAASMVAGPLGFVAGATAGLAKAGAKTVAKGAAKVLAKGAAKAEVKGATKATTKSAAKATLKEADETIKVANKVDDVADNGGAVKAYSEASSAQSATTRANSFKNAINTLKTQENFMSGATAIAKTSKFAAESVVQGIMCDPEALREAILSDDKDAVSEYVMTNLAIDSAFFGSIKGAGTIGKAVARTTPGQIAHAAATVKLNGFTAFVGNLNAKAKNMAYGGDYIQRLNDKIEKLKSEPKTREKAANPDSFTGKRVARKENKLEVAKLNKSLRDARKRLGDMNVTKGTDDIDEVMENVRQINKQRTNIMDLNNKIDAAKGTLQRTINKFLRAGSPGFTAAQNAVQRCLKSILKAEKKAGMKPKFGKTANDTNRLMSQETTDYISAIEKRRILENRKKEGTSKKGDADELKDLNQKIKTFNKIASPELKKAARDYINADRNWWKEANDYFASEGLISREELENLRKEGQFGKDGKHYAKTMRKSEYEEIRKKAVRENKTTTAFEHYKEGAKGDFVDPSFVKYDYLYRMASVKTARDLLQSGARACGYSLTTKIGSEKTVAEKVFKNVEKKFNGTMKAATRSMINEDFSQGINIITEMIAKVNAQAVEENLTKIGKEGRAVYKKAPKEIKELRPTARQNTINSLDDGTMTKLANACGYNTNIETVEEFAQFLENASDDVKEYLNKVITKKSWFLNGSANKTVVEKGDNLLTFENYMKMKDLDPEFISNLNRKIVSDNASDNLLASSEINNILKGFEINEAGVLKSMATKDTKKVLDAFENRGGSMDEIYSTINRAINNACDLTLEDKATQALIEKLLKLDENVNRVDLTRYFVLQHLTSKDSKDAILKAVKESTGKDKDLGKILASDKGQNLNREYDNLEKAILESIDDKLTMEFDKAKQAISGSEFANKTVFEEIAQLRKEIGDVSQERNVVRTLDENGDEIYVETDPLLADLVKTRPNTVHMGFVAKSNYIMSKLFRLGTTGLYPASWLSQSIRDGFMLYIGGNAYRGYKKAVSEIADLLPQNVGEYIMTTTPEAIAKSELAAGKAISPSAIEESAYRYSESERMAARTYEADKDKTFEGWFGSVSSKIDNLTQPKTSKASMLNPATWNERREALFRERAFNNGMADALKEGYTLREARIIAEFMMNNVTTNFQRRMYHLGNLQRTVPYLGAAVNGTKSFYRLMLLDPIGVTGRLMAGLCIPTMFLTAESLSDERNRQVYMSIPEYDKKDNLIFVFDGKAYSIPFPQELNSIVAPFRQMVEGMYNANQHTFWEFASSDLIGLSPIDLSGFVNLDNETCLEETAQEQFASWFLGGTTRVVSQLATPPMKAGFIGLFGFDPYTGKRVNTQTKYTDPLTGETLTMGANAGAFATAMGNIFGEWWSPVMADKLIGSLIGTVGVDILNSATEWCNLVTTGEGEAFAFTNTTVGRMSDKLSVEVYNSKADRAWYDAVRALKDEKEAIINDKEYQSKVAALQSTRVTSETKEEIRKYVQDKIEPFQKKLKTTVDNLIDKYDGTFDRKKLSSVISLLNFNSSGQLSVTNVDDYTVGLLQDYKKQGRDSAISTMMKLGFRGTNDSSAFGYYRTSYDDPEGRKAEIVYQNPVSLLAFKNSAYGGQAIHAANIEQKLTDYKDENGKTLSELKKERNNAVDAIYSKSKLSNSDYNNIDTIYNEYNKKVMAAINDYVGQYTAESAINNTDVLNVLREYIKVPSSYIKTAKGKYVSNLGNGNKQDAYVENYIKHLYSVKDKYGGQK